ncbi:GAF domain-containing protein [Sphingomonas sp. BK580]|uniref:GAF domain-containing protein n=1 Tax=Sphingomonas sp. BK580 TaxID=2586972 RepID=UPI00161B4F95|nr:GAF domain-containing protein [Sphingomonas sp. BK580]MBB3695809.1 GAF domain-containing protein [Sphingomonas sp. BK580]
MGIAAPLPAGEPSRQRAVDACGIVLRPRNPELQRIVEEAARLARAPIAAISVVDRSRQWLAARVGIAGDEGPRAHSFCGHTILRPGEPMIVADARGDRRFVANPSVVGHPHIRFYAGVPLVDHAGFALGALCVADTRPRLGLFDIYDLTHLARHAERIMAL